MTNCAPFFGVPFGQAYITASANYFDVVLYHSVVIFVPLFIGWAVLLWRWRFPPLAVFVLFWDHGSTRRDALVRATESRQLRDVDLRLRPDGLAACLRGTRRPPRTHAAVVGISDRRGGSVPLFALAGCAGPLAVADAQTSPDPLLTGCRLLPFNARVERAPKRGTSCLGTQTHPTTPATLMWWITRKGTRIGSRGVPS